jgi:hypothetical protein
MSQKLVYFYPIRESDLIQQYKTRDGKRKNTACRDILFAPKS